MITELNNLKVRALAVEVPNDFHSAEIEFGELGIFIMDSAFPELKRSWQWIMLPEGNWTILGRANELLMGDIDSLIENKFHEYSQRKYAWSDYCTANNLTNELILIESNH